MSVQVTLTFATVDDMLAHFAGKPVTHIKSAPTEVAAAPVEKPSKSSKVQSATTATTLDLPAPSSPTAEAAEAAAQDPSTSQPEPQTGTAPTADANSAADTPVVDYKQAAEAVTKLSRTKGRDAAVAVLKEFKADKLPDVKPEDFAAVVKACADAMGV